MPHIYNLAVGEVLRTLSQHEAYTDETMAINAEYKEEDLAVNPVLRIRGVVAAVSCYYWTSSLYPDRYSCLDSLFIPTKGSVPRHPADVGRSFFRFQDL